MYSVEDRLNEHFLVIIRWNIGMFGIVCLIPDGITVNVYFVLPELNEMTNELFGH